MKTTTGQIDLFDKYKYYYESIYSLQGVHLTIYAPDYKKIDQIRYPIIEVNSIEGRNLAFLSVGYENEVNNIFNNQLISIGKHIKFECETNKKVQIGITSYDGWLTDQNILTNGSDFEKLIKSEIIAKTSDIKLIVNSGNYEETIKCHTNILCIKSTYFYNLIESKFSESQSGEINTNCSKEAIIPILQYIYIGEIDKSFFIESNYETILEMYSKLCEYQMEKVKEIVEVFILAFLNEENLKLLFQSVILSRDDPFTMKAIKFIANYFK